MTAFDPQPRVPTCKRWEEAGSRGSEGSRIGSQLGEASSDLLAYACGTNLNSFLWVTLKTSGIQANRFIWRHISILSLHIYIT